jgi:hypothetical protein
VKVYTSQPGPFTRFGTYAGVSLNNRGQVAIVVKIAGGPDTLVLLTPGTP